MRLHQLDISGFKSFSDRAHLAFDSGVTAIVGPNGCGKSNLSDAITWVLGEQSAKSLRGDRMEEVIFSGSDARKPTAAAEVRAMFTDVVVRSAADRHGEGRPDPPGHDGDLVGEPLQRRSVEITRRLYRSGESEYLIDGEVCRLRDIHDLLMDTGLGAKAYAIIEQGKIGLILSSRPTDRRQLIEEAAGVTKYKARRRAAELKLEASQQNLSRVDDIVYELEKQVGSLKRQAAKARRYRRVRDELRWWEKVLFARRYREMSQAIEILVGRLRFARVEEEAASTSLATLETDLGRARIEIAEQESAATRARETVHAHEIDMGRLQQQIQLDEQQARHLEAREGEIQSECLGLEEHREPGLVALAERREALARASTEREEAELALRAAQSEHDATSGRLEGWEADVEAARAEVFAALNSATALRHAVEHAGVSSDRVGEQLSRLDVEREDTARELEAMGAAHAAAVAALQGAREAADATGHARRARESALAEVRADLDRQVQDLRRRERELAALTARLASLEDLDAARAGYTDAAKLLLAHADDQVGHMGSVADCLTVEPRFERAVEACLGDLLQYAIVRRREHAAAALQIVAAAKVGRCGLVVVEPEAGGDEPKARGERREARQAPPASGLIPLDDVLHIEGPYRTAIGAAIGPAWIAETLESALAAAPDAAAPVAALSGEVVRGPHVITGGAGGQTHGILTVKREIKELRERCDLVQRDVERHAADVSSLEEAAARGASAIEAFGVEQHQQEKTIVALELRIQRAREDAERIRQKLMVVDTERGSAEEERRTLDARRAEARRSIVKLEEDQRAADERLVLAQRRLLEARDRLDALIRRVAEGRAAYATLTERAVAIGHDVARLEAAAAELDARVEAYRADLRSIADRREALGRAVRDHQHRLDAAVLALDRLHLQVRHAEEQIDVMRTGVEAQEASVREARRRLEDVRAGVSALDLERATAESRLTHLAGSCVDTLQATLEEVVADVQRVEAGGADRGAPWSTDATEVAPGDGEEPEVSDDPDDEVTRLDDRAAVQAAGDGHLEARIAALRLTIERMGAVNMMAIEQFDELSARHTFLTTQRRDLVESIAATGETIRRIDLTTRERFRDAFEAINANFQETFGTLFGGGRAGLTLIDADDPLETGIEIVAQPPGKRLQNVQLLSGGEKALTAIALMFGIFKYKPSPFCVLDEIDAPLDEANIGRFVEMLKGMLGHTQFILITHNRKTMEIADRLYGVTMEEPGVSKLVSLRLN